VAGAVVIVVAAGLIVWRTSGGGGGATVAAATAQVTSGTVKQTVSATGTLEPAKTADLDFSVSGTVTHVYVKAGDVVTKGQALAEVSDTSLVAARTAAQASYDAAVAQYSQDASDGASAVQLAADQTSVVSAKASLASAKQDAAHAVLRATISGTVVSLDLSVGDVVGSSGGAGGTGATGATSAASSSSSSSAVSIASTARFVVDATVSADDAATVKKGMQAQVTVSGVSDTIYGTVGSVGLIAQTSSSGAAVFPVTIAITGKQKGLYAGTSATASIIVKQRDDVVTVSSRAIQTDGDETYVEKLVDGKAVKTDVTIGEVYGATTEITQGLSAGDEVQVPGFSLPSGGSGTRGGNGSFLGGNGGTSGGFGGGGNFAPPAGGFGGGGFPGGN